MSTSACRIKAELVDADGISPVRYWPVELFHQHTDGSQHLDSESSDQI